MKLTGGIALAFLVVFAAFIAPKPTYAQDDQSWPDLDTLKSLFAFQTSDSADFYSDSSCWVTNQIRAEKREILNNFRILGMMRQIGADSATIDDGRAFFLANAKDISPIVRPVIRWSRAQLYADISARAERLTKAEHHYSLLLLSLK